MSGRRAAAIAFGVISDLAGRLDAAGVPPEQAPSLDDALAAVWPLACQLAKLEKTAGRAGKAAARARSAVLAEAVRLYMPPVGPPDRPPAVKALPGLAAFDPRQWTVVLMPVTSGERSREVA